MRVFFPFLALLLIACGGSTSVDAGVDASAGADASSSPDGGPPSDGGLDASTPDDAGSDAAIMDASADDAGAADSGTVDSGIADAGRTRDASAATCNADAVRFEFLARGPLAVGTLCDEVVVCVANGSQAARVMAASSVFQCTSSPEAPCTGMTCSYRDPGGPSLIDAAELAEICAVTLVTPTPDVACLVYGP